MTKRITETAVLIALASVLAIGVATEIAAPTLDAFQSVADSFAAINAR